MMPTTGWSEIAAPVGPATNLRVVCYKKHGQHGDYRLLAFDGDRLVHSANFAWNVWLGHCYGSLLMPAFIEQAEKLATPC